MIIRKKGFQLNLNIVRDNGQYQLARTLKDCVGNRASL